MGVFFAFIELSVLSVTFLRGTGGWFKAFVSVDEGLGLGSSGRTDMCLRAETVTVLVADLAAAAANMVVCLPEAQ